MLKKIQFLIFSSETEVLGLNDFSDVIRINTSVPLGVMCNGNKRHVIEFKSNNVSTVF